jgi:MFS family permease
MWHIVTCFDALVNTQAPVAVPVTQRRILRVLVTSQILGGIGVGSGISVVGLMAYDLSGRESLSGVSASAGVIGTALMAALIARITGVGGRRPALSTGYAVGALGAVLAVVAAIQGNFPLHVLSSFLFGSASASNFQARFAATDLAEPDRRAGSLSTVVWATTIGAVLGPNLTGPGERFAIWVGLPPLAGAYTFSFAVFVCAALVQFFGLRPDPLLTARAIEAGKGHAVAASTLREAWKIIASRAEVRMAVSAIGAAHAVMVGVMVMTPVHMKHEGAELRLVGLTISLHVLGMYAFSPLVGRLADRIGLAPTIMLGGAQFIIACLLLAQSPADGSIAFTSGMVLLGLAWSFCLISASALVTQATATHERASVQGLTDLVMSLSGGAAGILAGVILGVAGYSGLAYLALLALIVPGVLLVRGRLRGAS